MTTPESTPSKVRDALLRESKDIVAVETIDVCRELHIRAMLGGAPVLNAHGLLTPMVSQNASIVVDPASIRHLRSALLENGWQDANPRQTFRILPSARLVLARDSDPAGLILYSVIPGFFADPEDTFDLIWERHKEIPLRGHTVRALGRINSAILASHDGLDGKASRARSNFDYFVRQFQVLLSENDIKVTTRLIKSMGGCAEMARLLRALGEEPCDFMLPSVAYVQWRLQVTDVSDQLRRVVAWLELGASGRAMMRASGKEKARSVGDAFNSLVRLPSTLFTILTAKRRWERSLR
jgi:hypothetical protein